MSARESISLEQIAAEIAQINPTKGPPVSKSGRTANEPQHIGNYGSGQTGKAVVSYVGRFGEVMTAFLKFGNISDVSRETGLTPYLLRRHFFGNPEFCNLLRGSNEQIFLEATKTLRDNNASFVQKAQQLAQDALNEMEELLHTSESEHIRFRVAKDLLDRDPLQRAVSTTRTHQTAINVTIEAKTLELAMKTAGELEAAINVTPLATEGSFLTKPAESLPPALEQKEIE